MTLVWQLDPLAPEMDIFNRVWIIDAPWAHPAWSQYAVLFYDLTTSVNRQEVVLHREGMTHEFLVYALDPQYPLDKGRKNIQMVEIHLLQSANHGYQFKADTNEAAELRVQGVMDLIAAKRLSPDTDYRRQWDALFTDGVTLRR